MAQANQRHLRATHVPYLTFSSKDRDSGTNTKFTVTFGNVHWSQEQLLHLELKKLTVPNEFPNVWPGADTMRITDGANTIDAQLPQGIYTETQLQDAVCDAFESLPLVTTCSIAKDPLTGQWSIIADSNIQISQAGSDSFLKTIGGDDGNFIGDGSPVIVMPGPVNLNRPGSVHVYMSIAESQHIDGTDRVTNLLTTLSNAWTEKHAINNRVYQDSTECVYHYPEIRHLDEIFIELQDEYGIALTLPPNFDVFFQFRLGLYRK
jgi:hypothetical protein